MELLVFFKCISFLPVLTAAFFWNKLERAQKYFGLFLLWGAMNDIKAVFFDDVGFRRKLYVFYALTEVVFFGWYLIQSAKIPIPKKVSRFFFISIIPFWALAFFILEDSNDSDHFSPLFDGVAAAFLSVLAALQINRLTQTKYSLYRQPDFWFSGGIFFYFFCNIFIFSVINNKIIENAWFIHNSFHAIAMIIYSVAFVSTRFYHPDKSKITG